MASQWVGMFISTLIIVCPIFILVEGFRMLKHIYIYIYIYIYIIYIYAFVRTVWLFFLMFICRESVTPCL